MNNEIVIIINIIDFKLGDPIPNILESTGL